MKQLLKVEKLEKKYGRAIVLEDISFDLYEGDVLGLIGLNGAGKSTCLKIILNLINKNAGDIFVLDEQVTKGEYRYLNSIGSMIETPNFYESLSGFKNLEILSSLYKKEIATSQIEETLKRVGLLKFADEPVSSYSLGMKQRLGLAQAIIHQPKILLLDEPLNGLDTAAIKDFRLLIQEIATKKTGIIISSHSLEELEKVSNKLVVIDEGKTLFKGTKDEFLTFGNSAWCLSTNEVIGTRNILDLLKVTYSYEKDYFRLKLTAEEEQTTKSMILEKIAENNIEVISLFKETDTLETIFLEMIAKKEELEG